MSISQILAGYGPLGAFCWWLTRLVDKQRRDNQQWQKTVQDNSHKVSGMSLALMMNAATYGPEQIRLLAEKEIKKRQGGTYGDQ